MSSTVQIILSLITLLFLSVFAHIAAPKLRMPYTVLLVLVGFLLIPLSQIEAFSFITSFRLTSDILFFVFLPILIFESAFNMNIRRIGENIVAISALSIVGLLLSALFIAVFGYWGLRLVGFDIPFPVVLLFGALISATDPVAILALFKNFGAPRRLALIFEGESLFNDATALALFLVVLQALGTGYQGATSLLHGLFIFFSMLVGGTVFGFALGWVFTRLLDFARHEHLQITLTMLAAHATFLLTEFVSRTLTILGEPVHLSSILATVIASLFIGNEGRFKILPEVQTYIGRFWGYAAFVANSLVFILLGLLFSTVPVALYDIYPALLLIILVVVAGRAFSVYPVIGILNKLHLEQPIPRSWQHLMAWGSLRGALAVTMVLMIPDTLSHPDWKQVYSIKEFILALTVGCIYFTLFVKATSINGAIRRFRINEFQGLEVAELLEGKVYIYAQSLLKLASLHDRPQFDQDALFALQDKYTALYRQAYSEFSGKPHDFSAMFARVLRIHALGIEKHLLIDLYAKSELSETAYRRISGKFEQQLVLLEHGVDSDIEDHDLHHKRRFPRPKQLLRLSTDLMHDPFHRFLYYRALALCTQQVIHMLTRLAEQEGLRLFDADQAFTNLLGQYRHYQTQTLHKITELQHNHPDLSAQQVQVLEQELFQSQARALEEMESSEVISPAVKTVLDGELRQIHKF